MSATPQILVTEAVSNRQVTCYRLEIFLDGLADWLITEGVAKRDPRDDHRPIIGQSLALARALRIAADRLERRAEGLVRHQDWVKEDKLRRSHRQEDLVLQERCLWDSRRRELRQNRGK